MKSFHPGYFAFATQYPCNKISVIFTTGYLFKLMYPEDTACVAAVRTDLLTEARRQTGVSAARKYFFSEVFLITNTMLIIATSLKKIKFKKEYLKPQC